MEGRQGKNRPGKIRLGRLAVDPVFLTVFVFFMLSSLIVLVFILAR
ncbi:MAG: hypothetical protein K6T66_04280 [Peptococcaceae bacterium]|nr:hypothetical protein [Peptococcaceae bacterium]